MSAVKTLSVQTYGKQISSNCACPEPITASLEKGEIVKTLRVQHSGTKVSSDCACPEPSEGEISVVMEQKESEEAVVQLQVVMTNK